jgi:hypothetical protein
VIWLQVVIALVFLAAHLPFLGTTLEDIDSVNFTLALRDFDVAEHRPHPPGSPLYVALGKLTSAVVDGAPSAPFTDGAFVLALWSALAAALAVFPLMALFRAVESSGRRAVAGTILTLTCPLFWFTALRPMSDLPGLTLALVAQALLATAFARQRSVASASLSAFASSAHSASSQLETGRLIVVGAFVAGVAVGMRSQSVWLTAPLLAVVLVDRAGRGAAGALLGAAMTFTIGVLVWLVPLVVVTGGPGGYWAALGVQAAEDFAGVPMLATHRSARALATALLHTFVWPWGAVAIAVAILALAVVGACALLWRAPRGVVLLAAAFLPYLLFHLLLQDTVFTRYALPLIPPMAYLAVRGVDALAPRALAVAVGFVAAGALMLAVPSGLRYASEGSPLHRALVDLGRERATTAEPRPVVAMHHPFAIALRDEPPLPPRLSSPSRHEWLEIVKYWRDGGGAPVWFLADPKRVDLAAIDPRSRRTMRSYRWSFDHAWLLSGVRPDGVDWQVLHRPAWFVAEGSALTPELAGVSRRAGLGPAIRPVVVFVRRRADPSVLMIGGRNLEARGGPHVRFAARLDGRAVGEWTVIPDPGFFLQLVPLEAGALDGEGMYARLEIDAEAADGSRRPVQAAVEQFDLQSARTVVFGFDTGWHEHEHQPRTGLLWRWTSEAANLRVHHAGRDLRLRVHGESPLRYFDAPPEVVVRAGGQVLARLTPSDDFGLDARLPADALGRAGGQVTIETTKTFVPDEISGNGDRRRLGLRIFAVEVR